MDSALETQTRPNIDIGIILGNYGEVSTIISNELRLRDERDELKCVLLPRLNDLSKYIETYIMYDLRERNEDIFYTDRLKHEANIIRKFTIIVNLFEKNSDINFEFRKTTNKGSAFYILSK
ncbi:hypothetical protein KC678_00605 [Candidatus Dojkabacteria bacterium]|uniref:Uncharacterized protein n=1 Tax=Candidatus Dojkabacteria bacterium TaxID=2099670 RepID=A0A955L1J3_9BACT|nr:hypothetical protein [Candidatus Dojkabacteria bacterium]